MTKETIDQLVQYHTHYKFLKISGIRRSLYTLRIFLANSKLLFFRQGFNAQLCLLVMLKKLRKVLDEGGSYVALLTDLSKAFDCIAHNLTLLNFNYTASTCHHWNLWIVRSSHQKCSVKKVLLQISQACNFIKEVILAQVFSCEFCEISKNTLFYRTPLVGASE